MPVPIYHMLHPRRQEPMFGYSIKITIKHRRGLHNIQPMGYMQSTGAHGIASDNSDIIFFKKI